MAAISGHWWTTVASDISGRFSSKNIQTCTVDAIQSNGDLWSFPPIGFVTLRLEALSATHDKQ